MKPKTPPTPERPHISNDSAVLRRRAETRLKDGRTAATRPAQANELQRLLHELQVHQIELEMQNEELQQARDKMEAGFEKYSDLYYFAPVGYLTLDREGTVKEANLTSARLLGIDRSCLLNRRLGLSVCAPDVPVFAAFLNKVFDDKVSNSCEVALLRQGKPPVEVRIEGTVAASGGECRVVLTDITEQRRAERDRLILNTLESAGILAGGIAHDFNNLLTVVLLNLELAQTLSHPDKELTRLLEAAKHAAAASADLTRQLLTFAREGAPVRKPIRLSGVIQESVRFAVSGSPARCEFSLAENLHVVEADAGQIGQVFRNLALNGREAMPEGGVISVRAENVVLGPHEYPGLPPGNYVRVSVADQGVGISKEALSKIFDPYFSTKQLSDQRGMGLGLAICYSVVQQHGGAISVESELGVGATFRLHLPASTKLPPKERAFVLGIPQRNRKVLVMDDEVEVRKLVGRLLEQMGHEVELVEDGQRAVEIYENAKNQGSPFDVVLLDLTNRGGIGGGSAIEALLKVDPGVKAIVMSGYTDDPMILDPDRYGFKGVLAKPFGTVRLREILFQALEHGTGSLPARQDE